MAQRENRYRDSQYNRRRTTAAYTEGNTVRVMRPEEMPARRERTREEEREEQRRKARIRRNRDKALQMSPSFVLFVSLAAICVLFVCVRYMQVQTSIVSTMNAIEEAEGELEELKAVNDLLAAEIRTNVDLDEIYRVATEELGMVRPADDQILYYDKTESEYVRQYESIP